MFDELFKTLSQFYTDEGTVGGSVTEVENKGHTCLSVYSVLGKGEI